MSNLTIELCPETGICSLVKGGTNKVDLLPFEVEALQEAGADAVKIREILADSDSGFAKGLDEEELTQIAERMAKAKARKRG